MSKFSVLQSRIFSKKIPLNVALIIFAVFTILVFVISRINSNPKNTAVVVAPAEPCKEEVKFIHTQGHQYIHPLLLTEVPEQSQLLLPVKNDIENYINSMRTEKKIFNASVYLLKLNTGGWIGINDEIKYNSTGYLRLAILIAYLKMSEQDPSILKKQLWMPPNSNIETAKISKTIPEGDKNYTVKELLRYMIVYPDTNAKNVLINNINPEYLENLFVEVGLEKPDLVHRKFTISVSDYSKFLHLLYNARYLNEKNSEYALQLLSEESSRKGMLKFLPENLKVIHKLSERFRNNEFELRESGIIYNDNDSYLLTIFATGNNGEQLDVAAGEISKIVYNKLGNQ